GFPNTRDRGPGHGGQGILVTRGSLPCRTPRVDARTDAVVSRPSTRSKLAVPTSSGTPQVRCETAASGPRRRVGPGSWSTLPAAHRANGQGQPSTSPTHSSEDCNVRSARPDQPIPRFISF